jgi:hypothetical protein
MTTIALVALGGLFVVVLALLPAVALARLLRVVCLPADDVVVPDRRTAAWARVESRASTDGSACA